MKIDTHQHFWKLDRGDYDWLSSDLEVLYRDYLPDELEPLLKQSGIDGTIAVQAADSEAETDYLLSLCERHDWIKGVVGWVDLEHPNAAVKIERLAKNPKLLGLRPMIQSITDDKWMLRDSLRPAISAMIEQQLSFDALVLERHLEYLQRFLARYPELTVVIDHCAKPEIRNELFEPWASKIAAVAQHKNVFCKISGLATEASPQWKADDLKRYIEHVCNCFGTERLLFGSDWPVLNLASNYRHWFDVFEQYASTNSLIDMDLSMSQNVNNAYLRM
jgi:L-fuconolactonase